MRDSQIRINCRRRLMRSRLTCGIGPRFLVITVRRKLWLVFVEQSGQRRHTPTGAPTTRVAHRISSFANHSARRRDRMPLATFRQLTAPNVCFSTGSDSDRYSTQAKWLASRSNEYESARIQNESTCLAASESLVAKRRSVFGSARIIA